MLCSLSAMRAANLIRTLARHSPSFEGLMGNFISIGCMRLRIQNEIPSMRPIAAIHTTRRIQRWSSMTKCSFCRLISPSQTVSATQTIIKI